jgi:predicted tellurium resistance membrane protein TerC
MSVETMWWISSGAFALLCLSLTLNSAAWLGPVVALRRLRSNARRSKGWRAILLWAVFVLLQLLDASIFIVSMPAAFGLFGHVVAMFVAVMTVGMAVRLVTERIVPGLLSRTEEM